MAQEARAEEQGSEGLTDGTRREQAQALGRVVALAEASLSQIRDLGRPKGDAARFDLREDRIGIQGESRLRRGLERDEDAKAQAIAERANAETRETAALAKQYGFEVCGTQP